MLRYILRRILVLIPTVWAISLITFIIIQLPPGDYLTTVQASLAEAGDQPLDAAELARLTERYGLNDPWPRPADLCAILEVVQRDHLPR